MGRGEREREKEREREREDFVLKYPSNFMLVNWIYYNSAWTQLAEMYKML